MKVKWNILSENKDSLPRDNHYVWVDCIFGVFRGIYYKKQNVWNIDAQYPYQYMPPFELTTDKIISWFDPLEEGLIPPFIQPERSKREDSQCEMRCSEHCRNAVRDK